MAREDGAVEVVQREEGGEGKRRDCLRVRVFWPRGNGRADNSRRGSWRRYVVSGMWDVVVVVV